MPEANSVDQMGGDRRGRDTDVDFCNPELRVRGGEGHISAADEVDPAAEASAVHDRDRRLGKFVEQLHRSGGCE
jgi:hypothetical protein